MDTFLCLIYLSLKIPLDGFQAVSKLQILDLSGNIGSLPEHPAFNSIPLLQELYLRSLSQKVFNFLGGDRGCMCVLLVSPWYVDESYCSFWLNRRMQLCLFSSTVLSLQHLRILDLSQNSLQLIPEVLLLFFSIIIFPGGSVVIDA